MRHRRLTAVLLLAIMLSVMAGRLSAAIAPRAFLPVVATGAPNVQTAVIYECQCGAVSAETLPDGTVRLTILDHSRGGAVVVGIDDGTRFREYQNTPMAQEAAAGGTRSSFTFPADKEGIGDTVSAWGKVVTYAPARDAEGLRYNIKRYVYTPVLTP